MKIPKIISGIFPQKQAVSEAQAFGDMGWSGVREVYLTPEIAAKVSALFACVNVISETISSLPMEIKGTSTPRSDMLLEVLGYQPNPLMTAADFWHQMAFNAILRGQTFAEPVNVVNAIELWPLVPDHMNVTSEERAMMIEYRERGRPSRDMRAVDLFRFSGLTLGGLNAVVPCDVANAAIKFAKSLETHGEKFFTNGARPSGTLTSDLPLSDQARQNLRKSFTGGFAGAMNAGKVPILESGLKFNPVSASNTDSQYIELRRNQVREIARYWRVPLYMLGEEDSSSSSTEQKALDFVKYVIRPWVRRIEQAIRRDLLTPDEREQFRIKFNLEGLLRGDSSTRSKNYVLWRTAGLASIDEIREIEGMKPIGEPWAQDAREPLNSNRAADTMSGGETSPQDKTG